MQIDTQQLITTNIEDGIHINFPNQVRVDSLTFSQYAVIAFVGTRPSRSGRREIGEQKAEKQHIITKKSNVYNIIQHRLGLW